MGRFDLDILVFGTALCFWWLFDTPASSILFLDFSF